MLCALKSTKTAGMGHVKVTGKGTEEPRKMTDGMWIRGFWRVWEMKERP